MVRTQSAAQRSRSAVASKITKACTWRIGRTSYRPRGLANGGASCYRNAALQNLLHLPKFVYWIMQHNEPRRNWPCATAPTDPNQAPPLKWADEPAIEKLGADGVGCVPCLLKGFIVDYWGPTLINATNDHPTRFLFDHPCWLHLHTLSDRWFYRDPLDLEETLNKKENINKTEEEKEVVVLEEREKNMSRQHDADEFMRYVLDGIEYTYAHADANGDPTKRKKQYDSLFTRTVQETMTCPACGHVRTIGHETPELGVRIEPLTGRAHDDVASAINRSMTEIIDTPCPQCSNPTIPANKKTGAKEIEDPRAFVRRIRVVAAPEYLRIHVNVEAYNASGQPYKNRKTLAIPEILDITQHMTYSDDPNPLPVCYKLRHVLYHQGDLLRNGHYAAAVTEMPPPRGRWAHSNKFFCNDSVISDFTNELMPTKRNVSNILTANPVNLSAGLNVENDYDPSIIWYERMPTRELPVYKGEEVVAGLAEGRVPRKGRGKRGEEYRAEVS
ncbi:cysteine proteinase [Ophiobolus disseminans]|uniref:Cysteine proteinase n=1 Tax=Ophiobolus disseminans TaxID=1469910 RepID=A0A6A6ZZJ6_9PLEO|nr:cysteine proteinase [Ophiobolus disseminans]